MPADQRALDSSYQRTLRRFNSRNAAAKYAGLYRGGRERREQRCILKALEGVPRGGRVLDIPCGAGRLVVALATRGFQVTGADSSPYMIAHAQETWRINCPQFQLEQSHASFDVRDVMSTGYTDGQFDAVICNRLFHHFNEAATRRAALSELRRICSGAVIVSFFNSFALGSLRLRFLRAVFRRYTRDRIPISLSEFATEGEAVGLFLVAAIPTLWGISPQWYAVFRPGIKHATGTTESSTTDAYTRLQGSVGRILPKAC